MSKPSICLCMIVRNEAHCIARCLHSVLDSGSLDSYAIIDTGSTDNTVAILKDLLLETGKPGAIVREPWVDFATNRNRVLHLARELNPEGKTYALLLDADNVLSNHIDRAWLTHDAVYAHFVRGDAEGFSVERYLLVDLGKPFEWRGVLHEFLTCTQDYTAYTLQRGQLFVLDVADGARSADPQKYARDAEMLERAISTEHDPRMLARYTFYLAQSYRDAKQYEQALRAYYQRLAMGCWKDEIFYSLYQIAELLACMGKPRPKVVDGYLRAYSHSPHRAEPLTRLAVYLQSRGDASAAALFAQAAARIPVPATGLFVDRSCYVAESSKDAATTVLRAAGH